MNFNTVTSDRLAEKYHRGKHKSGLDVIVIPKKQATLYALFATRYGSVDNRFKTSLEKDFHDVPEGIAHFLEHKLFENSDGEDTFLRFSKLGASCNAFTSNDVTAYLFTATENYYESLEELISFVSDPYFTKETVEKEMGIIEQELRMYEDNPHRALYENMLLCLYENHPVRIPVGGTPETIRKITPELLYDCYNTFYNPCNMMLIVCGDVDENEVARVIDSTLPEREKVYVEKGQYNEKAEVCEKYREKHFPISLPLFCVGVKDPDLSCGKNDALRRELEHTILLELLFGGGSSLFEELYLEGLINQKFDASYQVSASFSHSVISGESREPKRVYERILEETEAYRIGKKAFGEKDFARAVRQTWGMCAQVWNSTTDIGDAFLDYELVNSELCDLPEILSSITLEDIKARLDKSYREEYFALAVVSPTEE
ncbi:MAG: insulinase family protein [Clostridia bacterium]|nr:insulinase family protein [Clostridia bacterium]